MSQDSAPRTINRRPGGCEGTRAHAATLLTQEVTDQDKHGHVGAALPVIVVEEDGTAAEGETLAAVEGEGTAAEVEGLGIPAI
jgi:hypothetical protein